MSLGNFCGAAGVWTRPEAEVFLDVALRMGVPRGRILLETEATNTGENIRFSHRVLRDNHIPGQTPPEFLSVLVIGAVVALVCS